MDSHYIKTKISQGRDDRHMVCFCTKNGNRFLTEVTIVDAAIDLHKDSWPMGGVEVVLVGEEFMGTDMYGAKVVAHREPQGPPVVFENAKGRGDE
jgi:hypothetical protein